MNRPDLIAAQTRKIYKAQAQSYDMIRRQDGVESVWLERFLSCLSQERSILDLGCGSGRPISQYLIKEVCQITGVDYAPALLSHARQRFPDHQWIEQDIRALDLGNRQFDGLVCWGVIFHLMQEEQRDLITTFPTFLKPGAPLLITLGDRAGEGEGFVGDKSVYHASLSVDAYEAGFIDAGFEILDFVVRDERCGDATVLLARKPR